MWQRIISLLFGVIGFLLLSQAQWANAESASGLINTKEIEIHPDENAAGSTYKVVLLRKEPLKGSVFSLPNPARIVIDVSINGAQSNKSVQLSDSKFVQAIRIGSHPSKVRIVFDLKVSEAPQFLWSESGSSGLLSLLQSDGAIPSKAEELMPEPTVPAPVQPEPEKSAQDGEVLPTPIVVNVEGPKETVAPEVLPTTVPTIAPVEPTAISDLSQQAPAVIPTEPPAAQATPAKVSALEESPNNERAMARIGGALGQAFMGLEFDYLKPENSPAVRVQLREKTHYTLIKQAERVYELTIPKCHIYEDYLKFEKFPPQNFAGFTVIKPVQSGDDTVVIIGVEDGVRVTSLSKGNEIWLQAAH